MAVAILVVVVDGADVAHVPTDFGDVVAVVVVVVVVVVVAAVVVAAADPTGFGMAAVLAAATVANLHVSGEYTLAAHHFLFFFYHLCCRVFYPLNPHQHLPQSPQTQTPSVPPGMRIFSLPLSQHVQIQEYLDPKQPLLSQNNTYFCVFQNTIYPKSKTGIQDHPLVTCN